MSFDWISHMHALGSNCIAILLIADVFHPGGPYTIRQFVWFSHQKWLNKTTSSNAVSCSEALSSPVTRQESHSRHQLPAPKCCESYYNVTCEFQPSLLLMLRESWFRSVTDSPCTLMRDQPASSKQNYTEKNLPSILPFTTENTFSPRCAQDIGRQHGYLWSGPSFSDSPPWKHASPAWQRSRSSRCYCRHRRRSWLCSAATDKLPWLSFFLWLYTWREEDTVETSHFNFTRRDARRTQSILSSIGSVNQPS